MATRELKVSYVKTHDFKMAFSTGVFGGLASNGLINAVFFLDRIVIPNSQKIDVDENGEMVKLIDQEKDADVVREALFGVQIDVNTARKVVDWFNKRIADFEAKNK